MGCRGPIDAERPPWGDLARPVGGDDFEIVG